jgi:hypothetical protein
MRNSIGTSHETEIRPRIIETLLTSDLYFCFILSGVRPSPLGTAAKNGLLYQPEMIDDDDCGTIDGLKIGRGKGSTRRICATMPLCPQQIPHDLKQAQTRVAAMACTYFIILSVSLFIMIHAFDAV